MLVPEGYKFASTGKRLQSKDYVDDEKIALLVRVGRESVSTKKGSTPTEAAKNSTPRSTRLTREDVASFLDFDTDPFNPL